MSYLAADAREGLRRGPRASRMPPVTSPRPSGGTGSSRHRAAEGYFQDVSSDGPARLGEPTELAIQEPGGKILKAEPKTDFSPLAVGSSGSFEHFPVVFAGYGITAKDSRATSSTMMTTRASTCTGKAVLIIRREPQQDRDDSPFAGKKTSDYATFRHKATNAFQHGAAMVLLVNDLAGLHGDADKVLGLVSGGPEMISKCPSLCSPATLPKRSCGRGPAEPGRAGKADRRRFEAAFGS